MSWIKSAVGRAKVSTHDALPPLHARLGDWTGDFRDPSKFAEGFVDQLSLPGEISAMAYEPGMGYLAVGTSAGSVHLYGAPSVRIMFMLRPALRVKHMAFKSDTYLLICIGTYERLLTRR
ncbi:syntaxin binding protein [Malassezia pachydermatis]